MGKGRNWMHQQNSETAVATETLPATPTTNPVVEGPAGQAPPGVTLSPAKQRIREAIQLLEAHSAARVGGSVIGSALISLDAAYKLID